MTNHTYYKPTEAEEMLIAAGIAKLEHFDLDYEAYKKKAAPEFLLSYSEWQSAKKSWDNLNERYEKEIEPFFPDLTDEQHKLSERLLQDMCRLEVVLGY